jgi:anti-sigma B factor antagonist
MKLPTEIFGNVIVVHTPEEISQEQTPQLASVLTSLERSQVVVDLDGTETVDSLGLTLLLDAQENLRLSGGDLRISTSNTYNRKILEITRLDQSLEVFETVLEAVKSFT